MEVKKPLTKAQLQEFLNSKPKVCWAESTQVDSDPENRDRILKLIAKYMDWEDTDHVFISDESSFHDFPLEEEDYADLSKQLGFTVHGDDLICDVLAKMRGLQ